MSDLFGVGQDINTQSARGVYPTMQGGSMASASGAMTQNTNTMAPDPVTGGVTQTVGAANVAAPTGHGVYWWLGTLGLLMLLVFVARRAGGEEDFRNIRPTAFNFLTITLTSIVGITALKIIAAKYKIPGASDLIMAV